jgi:mannosyltransferase
VLCAKLGSRSIGIFAALAFMILPRVTWMAIEARSYALTATAAVWLTVILLHAIERRRVRAWVLYGVVAGLAVTLNVYLALLVLAHGTSLLLARRRLPNFGRLARGWVFAAAGGAVLALPVVRLVMTQSSQLPFGALTAGSVANTLFIEEYFTGAAPTVARSVAIPPTSLWAAAAIVLAACGWALMALPVFRRRIVPATSKSNRLGLLAIAVPWVVVPTALIIGYSLVVTPMYTGRYFSFTTPAVALLIGTSIAALARRRRQVVAIALLALIALPVFVSQRGPIAKNGTDWQQAAAILATHAKPGQDIYYGPVRAGSKVSTSKVRDAYPAVLSTLHDITLKKSGVARGQLWDSQWPVAHASATVDSTKILWVVVQHYGSPNTSTAEELRYFESAGLHISEKWTGSSTDVYLFTR